MYEGEVGGNVVDDYQNPLPNNREESKLEEEDGGSGGTTKEEQ